MQTVRGVVIGALKDCGNDAEMLEFLREFFEPLRIPVVRNFPIGHHGNNLLMPVGRTVRLSTREQSFTVTEPAVLL
jgi:muramoyltetrapeptide carboxypeptidase LdcA involved in peptidoglycan recycling